MISITDVQAAQDGNQDAFGRLVANTQNVTTSIALAIVRDLDTSEDVAQQVYIKVWQQIKNLKNPHSFLPWLRQITRYTAANYLRDNKVADRLSSAESDLVLGSMESLEDDSLSTLDKAQMGNMLRQFIDELPGESRDLVLLYYRQEQSTKQVAQLLDLSEENVRQKLSRVRQSLKREWLAKYGKIALTTAPGTGFSLFVLNAICTSAPATAATLTASSAAAKTGLFSKLAVLIGGGLIGALTAIFAILLGNKLLLGNIKDESYRPAIIRYRNLTIAWIIFTSILLALSYQLTSGWWAPVLSYSILAIGLVRLTESIQLLAQQAGQKKHHPLDMNTESRRPYLKILNWLGPIIGGLGLLAGLIASGRLVF